MTGFSERSTNPTCKLHDRVVPPHRQNHPFGEIASFLSAILTKALRLVMTI
jgi:hypothetical protein